MKTYRKGLKLVIDNLQLEVFKILQNELGYAYCKKSGREYFLKENYPNYLIREINHLKDDFIKYVKNNFDKLNIEEKVTLEEVLNVVYDKRPITKSYARNYLSFNSTISENEYKVEEDEFVRK
ncbi:hypothetical protein [Aquimarina macrocephali]|uniref:hypothetical protein n=1 Tax=Aquimarina macrocephali TaxID=666563 RepID=UPI003F666686